MGHKHLTKIGVKQKRFTTIEKGLVRRNRCFFPIYYGKALLNAPKK